MDTDAMSWLWIFTQLKKVQLFSGSLFMSPGCGRRAVCEGGPRDGREPSRPRPAKEGRPEAVGWPQEGGAVRVAWAPAAPPPVGPPRTFRMRLWPPGWLMMQSVCSHFLQHSPGTFTSPKP